PGSVWSACPSRRRAVCAGGGSSRSLRSRKTACPRVTVHVTEASTSAPAPSRLVVLAGPTAVGKGTVSSRMREANPDVWLSVSATTRAPRPGEVDGVHYLFVSDEEFDRM